MALKTASALLVWAACLAAPPRTASAQTLIWDNGEEGVWKDGGGGWRYDDGTPAQWQGGATALFTNGLPGAVAIAPEGVDAAAVRVEGAAVTITGGPLTLDYPAEITATNEGGRIRIEAPIGGVSGLTVRARGEPGSCVIAGAASFEGKLTLETGRLEFDGPGALGTWSGEAGEWLFTNEIENNGLFVTPHVPQAFSGKISGTGDILVTGLPDEGRIFVPGILPGSGAVSETNRTLASFTTNIWKIIGMTAGTGMPPDANGKDKVWTYCFISNATPGKLTFDLQQKIKNKLSVCLAVEAADTLTGIVVRTAGVFTRKDNYTEGTTKHDDASWTPYTETEEKYAVRNLCIFFVTSVAAFRGEWGEEKNQWNKDSTLTVASNALIYVHHKNGLPSSGRVEAVAGGEIFSDLNDSAGVQIPAHLGPGGMLTLGNCNAYRGTWKAKRDLFINGGVVRNLWRNGPGGNTGNDIYRMVVTNGATVEGYPLQLGDLQTAQSVEVRGDAPLVQNAGYSFSSRTMSTSSFTMDVDDVADGPDMIVSGPISGDNPHYRVNDKGKTNITDMTMIKTGPGMLVYSGRNTHSNCTTRIDEGILRFETDSAMGTGTNSLIVLNQTNAEAVCVLDIGSSVNTVGLLGLTGRGGTLDIREGGTIEFIDSSGVEWAPGAVLRVDGALEGDRIRFGTDASGLTAAQIGQIRLKDDPEAELYLDGDGWLRVRQRPPTVIWIIP